MRFVMGKIGILDVGGGLRSIYGAGVFDYCMDNGIEFDYAIGVSAGSANIGSFVSRQRGRNYRFYHDYAMRPQFLDLKNRFRTGYACDIDYMYGTLANEGGEDPWDFDTAVANPMECVAVTTDANTGKPVYFTKEAFARDNFFPFKASSNIPILNRPWYVGGMPCFDGGISDPLPIYKAFRDGCERVVVILTLPRNQLLNPRKDYFWAKAMKPKYPNTAIRVKHRSQTYNRQLLKTKELEKEGKVLIIAPESVFGMKTLTQDADTLDRLYHCGYADAKAIPGFLAKAGFDGKHSSGL